MSLLAAYRTVLGIFLFGLIVSGLTAFPLLHELALLGRLLGIENPADYESFDGARRWIGFVWFGLAETHERFPFLAYGTDWLAFGHLVIALFFIGPFVDPVRNEWVLFCGLAACVAVVPLALICGEIRGIPWGWRLIDCSFGLVGALPLLWCIRLTRRLREETRGPAR